MILFLQLNIHLGLPPGKYLAKSEHLLVRGINWKQAQEAGLVILREATYHEITVFIQKNEGGWDRIVCLGYL